MNKNEHFPINWTNGVKLNQKHFFECYYNVVEMLKNCNFSSLNNFNYGVGDKIDNKSDAVELEVLKHTDEAMFVKLKMCNALTRSGYPVYYYEGLYGDDIPTAVFNASEYENIRSNRFYVVVSINPYGMVPVGSPDPDVLPLHHPYVLPKIRLYVLPESHINTSFLEDNFLVISEVNLHDHYLMVNKDYIPPVQRICYSDRLDYFRKKVIKSLQNIKSHSMLVYRKNKTNNRKNTLADNTFFLCEDINNFYSQYIFYLEHVISHHPPIELQQTLSVLANYLSVSLNIMTENDRESLLQYYYQWSDIKPSDFTRIVGNVIGNTYSHMDIGTTVQILDEFIAILERLFRKISELEYIGLIKENIVVGDDSRMNKEERSSKEWSIID